MRRSNKYAAINFNEIYGPKKTTPSHSAPHSPLLASQNNPPRPHGRMLVLTRPTKPQPHPQPPPPQPKPASDPRPEPDSISLRPLGRPADSPSPFPSSSSLSISSPSAAQIKEEKQPPPLASPHKPEPFVPPHLRPGFVGREAKLEQDGQRQGVRARERHVGEHSPPRCDDGRPRSSGYEGMRQPRVSGSDPYGNRPSSGGNRPRSSGRNGSPMSNGSHPF
ncbi:hypothetical protein ACLOJK_009765 [Asimina triloba]